MIAVTGEGTVRVEASAQPPMTVEIPGDVAAALKLKDGEEIDIDFFTSCDECGKDYGKRPVIAITKKG